MGAVSAFTTGNYHCKSLMADVIKYPVSVLRGIQFETIFSALKCDSWVQLEVCGNFGSTIFCFITNPN